MIAALLIGFVGTLAAVVLFLLVVDPPEQKTSLGVAVKTAGQSRWSRFRRYRDAAMAASGLSAKPPAVAKEVIIAMAHRAVYRLNSSPANRDGCGDDDDQAGSWVRRMLASMCAKLDAYRPEVTRLQQIVDAFCGRLNAMCDTFEPYLCEYHDQLTAITEARAALEKELHLLADCRRQPTMTTTTAVAMVGDDDGRRPAYSSTADHHQPALLCPSTTEDDGYILSGYNYLIRNNNRHEVIDGEVDDGDDDDDEECCSNNSSDA